jgi:hypothetical protein
MARQDNQLVLTHLINWRSANVGNGALTEGAESVLGEDLRQDIRWIREPWDDYTFDVKPFDRAFLTLINDKSHGLVVGGAVTFNNRANLKNTGTRLDLPRELWSEIRRPVVFYGASYRHWPGQPLQYADLVRWTLDFILRQQNFLLGVRNDGTREWLKSSFGIESDHIHVIPDPGVFALALE